jgi:selenocysteine lyase/cysteine desulfurase
MKTISKKQITLENYFAPFRDNTIGYNQFFKSPFGYKRIVYADWIASGRLYQPIEEKILSEFAPFIGNTHTETNVCGTSMTLAYHKAREIIKKHVNAGQTDCIISYGSGMTGVINKFQRILGLKIPEKQRTNVKIKPQDRPIVFVTHMEHHSNQTSWLETICDVEVINPLNNGLVDLSHFEELLKKYSNREKKIAAITACSNVTGIQTPYHDIAARMHRAGGLCFVDFACSAPYVKIDMHPKDREDEYLDAIYFSPHKFLGGPGTAGILIFNAQLYDNKIPDNPGGGTVKWTNPWKEHEFIDNIEDREDGGTPPFLQTIRTALCIQLKEQMDSELMLRREEQLLDIVLPYLNNISNVHVLAKHIKHRLGAISFYIEDLHYNLGVKLLNDYFGIQVRGGCSCAGTYGHYLLEVDKQHSQSITNEIDKGNFSSRPGWIRLSLHPTMTDEEVIFICEAIEEVAKNHPEWCVNYVHDIKSNEFQHSTYMDNTSVVVDSWFVL